MKLDETLKLLALPVVGILLLALVLSQLAGDRDEVMQTGGETPLPAEVDAYGFEFVEVPAGSFVMGSPAGKGGFLEESPAVSVAVEAFLLGRFEVTQQQWFAVMGANPSAFKDPRKPVDSVSWYDIEEFIKRLNERSGGAIYRLPSEAEWEYAARAGTSSAYHFGDDVARLGQYAWVAQEGNVGSRPVGQRAANPWGLFDLYGNVWEWVADCWHDNYRGRPKDSRPWLDGRDCQRRVLRGGGWNTPAERARSAYRGSYPADLNDVTNGFRLAKNVPSNK